jgi:hypothetical protein
LFEDPPRPFESKDEFFRAINPDLHWKKPYVSVKSNLFKPKSGKYLSVDWAELSTAKESSERWNPPKSLAVVTAGLLWGSGLDVQFSPIHGENEAHCDILSGPVQDGSPEALAIRQKLARDCRVLPVHEINAQ